MNELDNLPKVEIKADLTNVTEKNIHKYFGRTSKKY